MAPPKKRRNTIPPYTCGVLQIDCGGGYCCPIGQVCFDAGGGGGDDDGQTTCRLAPGIPGTDQPASPAQGVVVDILSHSTTPTPSPSSLATTPTTTPPPSPSPTRTETWPVPRPHTSQTPDTRLTGTGVAGIVVGVLLLAGLLGGSAWSLWRRRRRERAREDALLVADGGNGHASEDVVKDFLAGAAVRRASVERRSPPRRSSWGDEWRQRGSRPEMGMDGYGAAGRQRQQRREGVSGRAGRTARGDEEDEGGMAYMYGGSNVGRSPGEVPGRVEAVGDMPTTPLPTHMVSRKLLAGQRGERAPVYEMDGSSPLARTAARGSTG